MNAAQDATAAAVGDRLGHRRGGHQFHRRLRHQPGDSQHVRDRTPARSPQKKGQSAGVKAFGKMMVTDHTAMAQGS